MRPHDRHDAIELVAAGLEVDRVDDRAAGDLLERRLDMVVYRCKFVATIFAARQFVNHGHVRINGKRVNIASYLVKVGDKIEVKESSRELAFVIEAGQLAERDVPDYFEHDDGKKAATMTRVPGLTEVPYPVHMEPNLVIEFYSR